MLEFATACEIALKTGVLLAVGGGLSLIVVRRSAALRHALLCGALLLSLCMPIAIVLVPAIAVIPANWVQASDVLTGGVVSSNPVAAPSALLSMGWQVWLGGLIAVLAYDLAGQWTLGRWRCRARPLESSQWIATLHSVTTEWGFDMRLRVLESVDVASPCTWGCLRPIMLLPADG